MHDNTKGTESVEFAAIEAYRQRLASNRDKGKQRPVFDNLDSIRMNQQSGPAQSRQRGINKNYSDIPSVLSNASKLAGGGNVIVETK